MNERWDWNHRVQGAGRFALHREGEDNPCLSERRGGPKKPLFSSEDASRH